MNVHTGKRISISRDGVGKMINNLGNIERAKLLPGVPKMIELGKLETSNAPTKPGDRTRAYHRFSVEVEIAGKTQLAHFLVKEQQNGHFYYNHDFGEVRK